jgi:2-C-methyl-D-erythritol 4-phosphate cytidylyltransferase
MKVIAIIPSAGLGRRIGSLKGKRNFLPKQFFKVAGKEILIHTIEKFEKAKSIDEIIISTGKDYLSFTQKLIDKYKLRKVSKIVIGGKQRQRSVYNAFQTIKAAKEDLICIHDAVRPFITSEEIDKVISFSKKYKSVITAVKANDTIKTGKNYVTETLNRDEIWLVQTPQVFSFDILYKAYKKAWAEKFTATDEASIVERLNRYIYFYEIQGENRKITTKLDLDYAHFILK